MVELPDMHLGITEKQKVMDRSKNQDCPARKKNEIKLLVKKYCARLSIPPEIQEKINQKINEFWHLFPKGSSLHCIEHFTEIIVFHVLKINAIPIDPDKFREASIVDKRPMAKRSWLLKYKKYLPKDELYPTEKNNYYYFLNKIKNEDSIDDKFLSNCYQIAAQFENKKNSITPKILAGVICLIAYKINPPPDLSLLRILESIGIKHPGSVYNAFKRFIKVKGIDEKLFINRFKAKLIDRSLVITTTN
ncbi:MAG: hypothetical protein ACTSWN_04055 [Promethearchaeota archaeon]